MKTACLLLLAITFSFSSFSQSKKQLRHSYWLFFSKYSQSNLDLIKEHWTENFRDDIYGKITGRKPENFHCLFLDSYGGVYPKEPLYNKLSSKDFYHKRVKHFNQFNNSHLGMFTNRSLTFSNPRSPLANLYDKYNGESVDQFDFLKEWNNLLLPTFIKDLKLKMKDKKKIIFFAHGYNVPYSLAVVQADAMMNQLTLNGIDENEVLFVPIFWPSNDQKKCKLDSSVVSSLQNLQIQKQYKDTLQANIQNNISLSNARRFTYYSNQAYFASLTLRQVLNGISDLVQKDSMEVMMISHSLGATILTSSLINTTSKLHFPRKGAPISDFLSERFLEIPIPEYKIKVFMSAPAIPGVNTFIDLVPDLNVTSNKLFFSTINPNDKSLNKKYVPKVKLPSKLSATTLGCNYNSDAGRVQKLFDDISIQSRINISGNFTARLVSTQSDHNIFSYLLQEGYLEFLADFVKTN